MRAGWTLMLLLSACQEAAERPMPRVIGKTSVEIDSRMITTRVGEAALGDWMMDLLLAEARGLDATVKLSMVNAGAIRGGALDPRAPLTFVDNDGKLGKLYPAGDLTDLDVAGWFPFNDDHDLLTLTGAQLKSVLERSANSLPPDLRNDKGGEFLQVAGMSYTIDCNGAPQKLALDAKSVMTEGTRITRIAVGGETVYDMAGGVDKLATLSVRMIINNFVSKGLDGHLAFTSATHSITLLRASFDLVAKMQAAVTAAPIAPARDGRITIVGDCGRPLTSPQ